MNESIVEADESCTMGGVVLVVPTATPRLLALGPALDEAITEGRPATIGRHCCPHPLCAANSWRPGGGYDRVLEEFRSG
jgi:hypothetical protein